MALILAIESPSGINASYWTIRSLNLYASDDFIVETTIRQKELYIELWGYYNKIARFAGKEKLHRISIIAVIGTDINIVAGDLRNSVYTYIKTLPDWLSAIDD